MDIDRLAMAWRDWENRVSRVSVLVERRGDVTAVNLCSVIRHRRADSLGPWLEPTEGAWRQREIADNVVLFVCDTTLARGVEWLSSMRSGSLAIDGLEIQYAVVEEAREFIAVRDWTGSDHGLGSPFGAHGARAHEYWGFDTYLTECWMELRDDVPAGALAELGLDLVRFIDRVANVVVFGANDVVECEVGAALGGGVYLRTQPGAGLEPGELKAVVWAYQAEDVAFRRLVDIAHGTRRFPIQGDVGRIGFELFRASDGICLDRSDAYLIRSTEIAMDLAGAEHQIVLGDKGRVRDAVRYQPAHREAIVTRMPTAAIDERIHASQAARRADETKRRARARGEAYRFQPGAELDAVATLVKLIGDVGAERGPVYLADPRFHDGVAGGVERQLQACIDILTASGGRSLRVLVAPNGEPSLPPWWGGIPRSVFANVEVRAIQRLRQRAATQDGVAAAFHDRYLITPKREVVITHSINGWLDHGVTFATLPYGLYREEAEHLWLLPLGNSEHYRVTGLVP